MTTVEHGPALQRAVERLAVSPRAAGGPYTGWIDRVTTEWIGGWAYDSSAPDRALTVVVYDGKTPIGAVLAGEPRADLEAAGFGDGRHGFTLDFGSRLNPRPDHTMSATILGTGEWLQGGLVDLRCEPRLSQTHRTLDLGQAFVGPVLDDVLDDPHGRRHIALPMRSNSAGPTVSQAFRHLMTHQRASSLRLSTPQEAIAALRVQLRGRAPSR
ncbi:MAG TPA: hypothetical protein DCY40_01095 [Actinobacteria bacterium]|nr:hypothetical protein [Actinomycetota bacterium]